MPSTYHVGILVFNYVDALDFAGPYEVFNLTTFKDSDVLKLFTSSLKIKPFTVNTVSHDGELITVHNGLKVKPDYSFADAPSFDIIIVPGGPLKAMNLVEENKAIISWIQSYKDKMIASVCTGAFFLAKAGLLDGKKATTNRSALKLLEKRYPTVDVIKDVKYVDEDKIITAAGVSAGLQMALHVVGKLYDKETSARTAYTIELD